MRLPRIYQLSRLRPGETIRIHEQASHHLLKVLRLPVGAPLTVFNGRGGEFAAELVAIEKRHAIVKITAFINREAESSLHITLLQSVAKGERMDWIVQKATELGVTVIIPLLTERSNVKLNKERWDKKVRHWQAIAEQACEQCGRNIVPLVQGVSSLEESLTTVQQGLKLFFYPQAPQTFSDLLRQQQYSTLSLLIGAEGGWSEQELALALQQGYQPVQLGPRILRTETAAVAAIAGLQATWGDH